MRSLVTDITVTNDLPNKMTTSFEFKTNKMSDKLAADMTFDMPSKSFSFTLSSPFETVRSMEITSAVTPRISAVVKLNGKTYFSVNGNGKFESWYKHDLDVTVTYPFFNEYVRLQVCIHVLLICIQVLLIFYNSYCSCRIITRCQNIQVCAYTNKMP